MVPSNKTKQANTSTRKYLGQNKWNCSEKSSKSQAFLCFQSSYPQSVLFNPLIAGMVTLLQDVNLTSGWQLYPRMEALPQDGSCISRQQLCFRTPTPKWLLYLKMAATRPGIASKFQGEIMRKKHEEKNSISLKKSKFPEVHRELPHHLYCPELHEMSKSVASKFWS